MRTILLSINPKFVEKILFGDKKFEFRKICPRGGVDRIVIYSTAPVSMVIGHADVANVIIGNPAAVWEQTKQFAGIDKRFFDSYYAGRDTAIAFELINLRRYKTPKTLQSIGVGHAPQSFIYLPDLDIE